MTEFNHPNITFIGEDEESLKKTIRAMVFGEAESSENPLLGDNYYNALVQILREMGPEDVAKMSDQDIQSSFNKVATGVRDKKLKTEVLDKNVLSTLENEDVEIATENGTRLTPKGLEIFRKMAPHYKINDSQ